MAVQKDELYQILRERLLLGKYPEGEPLPSGRQLGAQFGANKDCANTVLAALEAEGLLRRAGAKRFPVRRHRSEERVIAIEHVSHKAAHPFLSGFNEGLLDSLLSCQYGASFFTHYAADDTPIHRGAAIASLLERGILRGVLFPHWYRPSLEDLQVFREHKVASVAVERENLPGAVVLDIEQAALRATHYLLTMGRSPVGLLCLQPSRGYLGGDIRGYRQALQLADKATDEDIIVCVDPIPEGLTLSPDQLAEPYDITLEERFAGMVNSAYESVMNRIKSGSLPRALYIADEFLAIGAVRAIHIAGLRIPDDVAIVSHSSANDWSFQLGGLTTMRFDPYSCGVETGHFVVERAEGKRSPEDRLILQASLIKGGSCGEKTVDSPPGIPTAQRQDAKDEHIER